MEALNHGLKGKDSLSIAGGTFVLTCGKDGLRSENTEDASLGSVYIQNGEFQIDAQGDAVSASGARGAVTTNDGSEENPGAMGGGQGGMGGKMGGGHQNSTTPPSSTAP